jgi:cation diffusion facilitator family transporter
MAHESTGAIYAAAGANLAIAAAKFVGGALTGSTAMIAEGVHSVVDTANQVLLLVGMKRAERPADERHPFGYGREIYFYAFVVALMIFLGGGCSRSTRASRGSAIRSPTWMPRSSDTGCRGSG